MLQRGFGKHPRVKIRSAIDPVRFLLLIDPVWLGLLIDPAWFWLLEVTVVASTLFTVPAAQGSSETSSHLSEETGRRENTTGYVTTDVKKRAFNKRK